MTNATVTTYSKAPGQVAVSAALRRRRRQRRYHGNSAGTTPKTTWF